MKIQIFLITGSILNRTVILPKFHCPDNSRPHCTILHHLFLKAFETEFNYRETSFLSNALVPQSVKQSLSDIIVISTGIQQHPQNTRVHQTQNEAVTEYTPKNKAGADSAEIMRWFNTHPARVLRFSSLVGVFARFTDKQQQKTFETRVKRGFIRSTYKQMEQLKDI